MDVYLEDVDSLSTREKGVVESLWTSFFHIVKPQDNEPAQVQSVAPNHTNTGDWPSFSGYRSLDPTCREIRLLSVTGVDSKGTPQCKIQHAKLGAGMPTYHALSYYWGATVPKDELLPLVVDQVVMHVRPTTSRFLSCVFAQVGPVTVWLDIICINQDDVAERSSQVSMMGKIFATASGVYAWLGEPTADIDFVFSALSETSLAPNHTRDVLALEYSEQIFLRPYWTRMWVVQEFVMAREVTLVCGTKSLPWAVLDRFIAPLPRDSNQECWKRYQRLQEGRQAFQQGIENSSKDGLYELMQRYQDCRCSDPRDKVFAILGLSSEGSLVRTDYSITIVELFYKILSLHPPLALTAICRRRKEKHSLIYGCGPLQAASRIQKAMAISDRDLDNNLQTQEEDRLYAWFNLAGSVEAVSVDQRSGHDDQAALHSSPATEDSTLPETPQAQPGRRCYVKLNGRSHLQLVVSDKNLLKGDLVYGTSKVHQLDRSTYLFYRPSTNQVVDLMVMGARHGPPETPLSILDTCLPGMTICTASSCPRAKRADVLLFHLSRQAHYILWRQPRQPGNKAVSSSISLEPALSAPECNCIPHDDGESDDALGIDCTKTPGSDGYLACHTITKVGTSLKPMSSGKEGTHEVVQQLFSRLKNKRPPLQ